MVQRGEDSGFTLEPGEPFRVIGEEVREDFEGYDPAELRILRQIHLPHADLADVFKKFVMRERCAEHEIPLASEG